MKSPLASEVRALLFDLEQELGELQAQTSLLLQRYLLQQCRRKLGFPLVYRPRPMHLSRIHNPHRFQSLIVVVMEEYMRLEQCSLQICVRTVATALEVQPEELYKLWRSRGRQLV